MVVEPLTFRLRWQKNKCRMTVTIFFYVMYNCSAPNICWAKTMRKKTSLLFFLFYCQLFSFQENVTSSGTYIPAFSDSPLVSIRAKLRDQNERLHFSTTVCCTFYSFSNCSPNEEFGDWRWVWEPQRWKSRIGINWIGKYIDFLLLPSLKHSRFIKNQNLNIRWLEPGTLFMPTQNTTLLIAAIRSITKSVCSF